MKSSSFESPKPYLLALDLKQYSSTLKIGQDVLKLPIYYINSCFVTLIVRALIFNRFPCLNSNSQLKYFFTHFKTKNFISTGSSILFINLSYCYKSREETKRYGGSFKHWLNFICYTMKFKDFLYADIFAYPQ